MSASVHVEVTVNGERREADVEARLLLVHWLRDELGLTGTHVGCDTTNCGACTVHLNGEAVKSCTVLDGSGRRRRGHDHRGPLRRQRPAPGAGRLLGEARPPVRLLHARG